jgi:flagellar motor switch protein FliM
MLPFDDATRADAEKAPPTSPTPTTPPPQPRDRATALAALADEFAQLLAGRLHEHLGSDVSAVLACVEAIPYRDYLACLSRPTCVGVLRFDPPGAQGCLDLGPDAIFPMIDRLLGGRTHGPVAIPARPLTDIERGFALQIIERAARALADSWAKALPGLEVREEQLDPDPDRSHLMPGDEIVTVVRLLVRFSGCQGRVGLCVPAPVIDLLVGPEPASESPAETLAGPAVPPATGQDPQALQKNILQQAVELRALLHETKVRLSDVIEMQAGDIITTDHPVDSDVPIYAEGQEFFRGRLGQFRGQRAIEITQGDGPAAVGRLASPPAPATTSPAPVKTAPTSQSNSRRPADGGAARS